MNSRRNDYEISALSRRESGPIVFCVAFAVGAGLIIASKALNWPTALMIAGPLSVMAVYVGLVLLLPGLDLRRDQLGDNIYYLGFLLTLISLAVTLVQYQTADGGDYMVSNFGIALSATVVGILGRTVLGQMRKDVAGAERNMQASLAQATTRLRGHAFAAVETFSSMQRQMAQISRDSTEDIAAAHEVLAETLSTTVGDIAGQLKTAVDDGVVGIQQSFGAGASGFSTSIDASTSQFTDAMSSLTAVLKAHQTSVSETTARHSEVLEGYTNSLIKTLGGQADVMALGVAEMERRMALITAMDFDVSSLNSLAAAFQRSSQVVESHSRFVEAQLSADLAGLHDRIQALLPALEALETRVEATARSTTAADAEPVEPETGAVALEAAFAEGVIEGDRISAGNPPDRPGVSVTLRDGWWSPGT